VHPYWTSALRLLGCLTITLGLVLLPNGGAIRASAAPSSRMPQALPKVPYLNSVQCPTAGLCVAGGGGVVRSTDGGRTWTTTVPKLPERIGQYLSVSCPSPMLCVAVGEDTTIARSTDGGRTWSVHESVIPDGSLGKINAVSCPSVTVCMAEGVDSDSDEYLLRSVDAGRTWSLGQGNTVEALSCISVTQCVSVAITIDRSTDGGTTWRTQYDGTNDLLYSVQCLPAGLCVAVGTHFRGLGEPPDGSSIVHSTDSGRTWTSRHIAGSLPYKGVSCPSVQQCVAVSQQGTIATSHDGARTWRSQTVSSTESLQGVSCPTTTLCVAVGWNESSSGGFIVRSVDGGRTWSQVA
jgi:photosystem II stability/assembly factor-like uncharacterized protein